MKNVKLIFKSLISNGACVEGARHRPWYFAVIILFISMILGLVPLFTMSITKKGSDSVATNSYQMDVYTTRLVQEMQARETDLVVSYNSASEKNILVNGGTKTWHEAFTEPFTYKGLDYHYYGHHIDNDPANATLDFQAFYVGAMTNTELESFLQALNEYYTTNSITLPSMLVMSEETVYVAFMNRQKGTSIGSLAGDYMSTKQGWKFTDMLAKEGDAQTVLNNTWTNFKVFLDEIYNRNRKISAWSTTGIMAAINGGLIFFMGLMVFILTRGKNNPFRIYTFWESMKIAFWASLTPAILTCGFGFLFKNFAQVMFALLIGIRVMWLTMKTLGPNNAPTQPAQYKQVKTVDAKPVKK